MDDFRTTAWNNKKGKNRPEFLPCSENYGNYEDHQLEVTDDDLVVLTEIEEELKPFSEGKLTSIFETFNIEVEDHDIEAIHRLFSRDSVKEIHQKKNRLKDLNERYEELAG